jgi:hypothetical protein
MGRKERQDKNEEAREKRDREKIIDYRDSSAISFGLVFSLISTLYGAQISTIKGFRFFFEFARLFVFFHESSL